MADQLSPKEIALAFGTNFPPNNMQSVKASIISESDNGGMHLKSAKLVVEYALDSSSYHCFDTPNPTPLEPPGYQVNFNELGFITSDVSVDPPISIVDSRALGQAYITLEADFKYINLKIPIQFTKKRDSGD
ncbi:MAG: hypothetical protein V4577_23215 [Bacteroidota bacterium]